MSQQVTLELSNQLLNTPVPEQARDAARQGVLDYVMVTLALLEAPASDSGWQVLRDTQGTHDLPGIALLLGYAGHALDFDDFHPDFRGHPSTVILPALFALAGKQPFTHEQFLDAYCIGIEVAGRLGLAMTQRHYNQGFHTTSSLGGLAACAAACRLLSLSSEQTAIALGIAATQASGLRAQIGSAVKPLHAGLAAHNALRAVLLAQGGFFGQSEQVLESFFAIHSAQSWHPEALKASWGEHWRIISPGLEFKPYASCSGTHCAALATQQLRQQWLSSHHSLDELLSELSHIEVSFPPGGDIATYATHPKDGIESLTLQDFAEGPLDAQIAHFSEKVQRCPDFTAPADEINPAARFHEVRLVLNNQQVLTQRLTRQQLLRIPVDMTAKLASCLPHFSQAQQQQLFDECQLQEETSLTALCNRLRQGLLQTSH
jgi:2-methylcitrate dehydratase PrpD